MIERPNILGLELLYQKELELLYLKELELLYIIEFYSLCCQRIRITYSYDL